MAIGSLEAALRERGMLGPSEETSVTPQRLVHRPDIVDDRVPSVEQAARPEERMTLWGRCGYVPESRIRLTDE